MIQEKEQIQVNPVEACITEQGKLVAARNAFQPLALRAMFWRPNFWAETQWLEHLPFAFWLMEAARPRVVVELGAGSAASYFAFCQAVERLELETRCHAVHPWPAAGTAGAAEPGGFDNIHAYNESQYAGFSRLVRSDLHAAVHQFANGSIDLLHLGEGAADLTSDDLESWLPKLSDRGLLLVHGAARREGPARMHRVVEHLRPEYRSFEFAHGQGLALLTIGAEQPELLKFLCDVGQSDGAKRAVQEVFFRLGRACADSHGVMREKAETRRLSESVARQQREVAQLQTELQQAQQTLVQKTTELQAAHESLDAQVEEHAVERGQLAEKVTLLQEIRADLKSEVERLGSVLQAAQADLLARSEQAMRLEHAADARQAQIEEIRLGLQQRDDRIAALQQAVTQHESELVGLGHELAERRAEVVRHLEQLRLSRDEAQEKSAEAAEQAQQAAKALQDQLAAAEGARVQADAERAAQVSQLGEENRRLQEQLAAAERARVQADAERAAQVSQLGEESRRLQDQLAAAERARVQADAERAAQVSQLGEENRRLQDQLAAAEFVRVQAIAERAAQAMQLGEENRRLQDQLAATARQLSGAETDLATGAGKLAAREQEIAQLASRLAGEQERVRVAHGELQERDVRLAGLDAQVRRLDEEVRRLQEQLSATARQLQTAEAELATRAQRLSGRDREIAQLTGMLMQEEEHVRAARNELQQRDDRLAESAVQTRGLEAELQAGRAARQALERKLDDRFRELAELTSLLMREEENAKFARGRLVTLQREFGRLLEQHDAASGKVLQKVLGRSRPADPERAMILKSGLFDPVWYLQQYPDVANEAVDPVKHYLRFGAAENRDPGPCFSTARYVATNRDALAEGENPLLHFLSREAGIRHDAEINREQAT